MLSLPQVRQYSVKDDHPAPMRKVCPRQLYFTAGVVAPTCHTALGRLGVQDREFEASLSSIVRLCFKKKKKGKLNYIFLMDTDQQILLYNKQDVIASTPVP